jgi:hypothetical protein
LAQLCLDSLKDKTSVKEIRDALKLLKSRSQPGAGEDKKREELDKAYDQAMERIDHQMPGLRRLGRDVLSWITCARRPLTTTELRHALAVAIGDHEFDKDNLRDIEQMVSVCAGLVTVDKKSGIIRLVHYTTQEYFEQTQKFWFPDAQGNITRTCITYLSFDVFEAGFCSTDEIFEARLYSHPLYDYASRNWGYHARGDPAEVEQLTLNFLESEAKLSASSQAMMASAVENRVTSDAH